MIAITHPAAEARLGVGLYSVRELSRYLSLPLRSSASTLRRWVRQGLAPSGHQGGDPTYGFHDLVSLMVVGQLRAAGVKLAAIREAEMFLRGDWGVDRPFATGGIETDGVNILIRANPEIAHQLTAANRHGQEVIEEAVREVLRTVHYEDELARWWDAAAHVRLDPAVQFGAPCLSGTRVPTAQLRALHEAGDPPERLSSLYELPLDVVVEALEFESALSRAA